MSPCDNPVFYNIDNIINNDDYYPFNIFLGQWKLIVLSTQTYRSYDIPRKSKLSLGSTKNRNVWNALWEKSVWIELNGSILFAYEICTLTMWYRLKYWVGARYSIALESRRFLKTIIATRFSWKLKNCIIVVRSLV